MMRGKIYGIFFACYLVGPHAIAWAECPSFDATTGRTPEQLRELIRLYDQSVADNLAGYGELLTSRIRGAPESRTYPSSIARDNWTMACVADDLQIEEIRRQLGAPVSLALRLGDEGTPGYLIGLRSSEGDPPHIEITRDAHAYRQRAHMVSEQGFQQLRQILAQKTRRLRELRAEESRIFAEHGVQASQDFDGGVRFQSAAADQRLAPLRAEIDRIEFGQRHIGSLLQGQGAVQQRMASLQAYYPEEACNRSAQTQPQPAAARPAGSSSSSASGGRAGRRRPSTGQSSSSTRCEAARRERITPRELRRMAQEIRDIRSFTVLESEEDLNDDPLVNIIDAREYVCLYGRSSVARARGEFGTGPGMGTSRDSSSAGRLE